ncbi:hypothetical protein G5I_02090 [Acromyrmex echinatior]|uniref:Uncharacterized protein n=1 Tax=Acromyrmex echinatior TaxID=103372 RepID=F4W9D9_ACREC|nr:hypothetical protein G5I_02090 [Acromyrmex echinatior]
MMEFDGVLQRFRDVESAMKQLMAAMAYPPIWLLVVEAVGPGSITNFIRGRTSSEEVARIVARDITTKQMASSSHHEAAPRRGRVTKLKNIGASINPSRHVTDLTVYINSVQSREKFSLAPPSAGHLREAPNRRGLQVELPQRGPQRASNPGRGEIDARRSYCAGLARDPLSQGIGYSEPAA